MSIKTTHAWRKGDDFLDRDGKTIWRIQILNAGGMLATRVKGKAMKQTGIKLDGYVLKDGKLVRDPKHLDASQRKKRQAAVMKRKKGKA